MNPNVTFLLNQTPDQSGRFVLEYRTWSESEWEQCHDHMQWAFPTRTKSAYNPDAQTIPADFKLSDLSADDAQRCKATISLLLHSYLKSLGVEFLINRDRVTMTNVCQYNTYWASSYDHNSLRMTRVLECLGIFEMYNIQTALHDFLVYEIAPNSHLISPKTVAFWVAAKENKLHLLR